ncbi:alpha/beta fold hydrolase [Actinopolymorpha pittospori]|uniref:alpha/beta fold hydrolase n=1 Tax=Actinopolymorpha pittospori TaxID=648752 RepID=UPI003080B387
MTGIATGPGESRAPLLVALHGGGYNARYYDLPGHSLLDLAEATDFQVIALNRPGYRGSERIPADGITFADNAEMLDRAIDMLWRRAPDQCPGVVVIAHSVGAAIAVHLAARHPHWPLLGVALNGLIDSPPQRFVDLFHGTPPGQPVTFTPEQRRGFMYGPNDTIDPDIIQRAEPSTEPAPREELLEINDRWPADAPGETARVTVPIHCALARFDVLWEMNRANIDTFTRRFTSAPSVETTVFPRSGHNIDHHRVGRELHLRQLAFAWQCAFDR